MISNAVVLFLRNIWETWGWGNCSLNISSELKYINIKRGFICVFISKNINLTLQDTNFMIYSDTTVRRDEKWLQTFSSQNNHIESLKYKTATNLNTSRKRKHSSLKIVRLREKLLKINNYIQNKYKPACLIKRKRYPTIHLQIQF